MVGNAIRSLALLLPLAVAADSPAAEPGVPDPPLDYSQSVDQWWAGHPMNPSSSNYLAEIASPKPVIDLADHAGDLQQAIDALPAAGGTIRIPAGVHSGGFEMVGRKNIHLIGDKGAVISGKENYVIGAEKNHHYHEFNVAVMQGQAEATSLLRDLPSSNICFKNIVFEQSPVRLACSRAVLFDGCTFRQPENRNVGDKDAQGKKVLRWWRPLPVTGIMGIRSIWFRDCEFAGHHANAIYLDGPHGSGMVNCRFAGVDRLWDNAVILFTNDDLSLDIDGDEKLSPYERRDTRYFVFDGCSFGQGYKRGAIAVSGRDVLVQNCKVEGKLDTLMVVNAKTSGREIYYESFGVKAINNQLPQVASVITAEGARNRPKQGVPDWWVWTKYKIGHFEIRNNLMPAGAKPLREIPNDSEILGPHVISGNGPEAGSP